MLALGLATAGVGGTAASAAESYSCRPASYGIGVYTDGDPGRQRWGNVALHSPLPSGDQVTVTLRPATATARSTPAGPTVTPQRS